jgi:hypothetical protein
MSSFSATGASKRDHDERNLEEVDEEAQHEHQEVHKQQEAQLSTGQLVKQVLDPDVTIGGVEGEAEDRGADQDEHHEDGQLGAVFQRLLEQLERQRAAGARHDQRAKRTHGAAFGGCGNAQKDGAQHQKNQHQRRNQHEGDALGQTRQQPQRTSGSATPAQGQETHRWWSR